MTPAELRADITRLKADRDSMLAALNRATEGSYFLAPTIPEGMTLTEFRQRDTMGARFGPLHLLFPRMRRHLLPRRASTPTQGTAA